MVIRVLQYLWKYFNESDQYAGKETEETQVLLDAKKAKDALDGALHLFKRPPKKGLMPSSSSMEWLKTCQNRSLRICSKRRYWIQLQWVRFSAVQASNPCLLDLLGVLLRASIILAISSWVRLPCCWIVMS